MYCPNPACSYLMKFGVVADYQEHLEICVECGAALRQGVTPLADTMNAGDGLVDVYTSPDEYKVATAKSMLEAEGIECVETGLYTHCIFGGALDTLQQPTLQVAASRAERVRELLAELDAEPLHAPAWTCPECGTLVAGELDACWRCAGDPPTDADPDINDDDEEDDFEDEEGLTGEGGLATDDGPESEPTAG